MPSNLGRLHDLPRADLCHRPTPLEPMANLSADLGRRLWVKRDDCTGLAFGGNKARQLEFYFGDALAQQADTILITGAVQSNFVRMAAAAARKLGLEIHIQLEERVPKKDPLYKTSGNVLLDKVLGATLYSYPAGEDEAGADRRVREIGEELRGKGRTPYVIPLAPGHPPKGALGYVLAAEELLDQLTDQDLDVGEIVVPSGSGHTHGGLLFGLRALGSKIPVTGVCVRRDAAAQRPRIAARVAEIAELLGIAPVVAEDDIRLLDDFLAPGYGQLNEPTLEAMSRAARREALILDPVYSGKTMAGFLARAEAAAPDSTLLFLHTGGTPAVFAYASTLADTLGEAPAEVR